MCAGFSTYKADRLADHVVDELHALVDAAGTDVKDLLRQADRLDRCCRLPALDDLAVPLRGEEVLVGMAFPSRPRLQEGAGGS